MYRFFPVLLISLSLLSFAGCAESVHRFESMIGGPEIHEEDLSLSATKFNQARYWGDVSKALGFVAPAQRDEFSLSESDRIERERLVKSKLLSVHVDEGSEFGTVDVSVKFYKIPNYVVNTRLERQLWEFHAKERGWRYRSFEIVDKEG